MPSTQQHMSVRGQANLHDSPESNSSNSNKRKNVHKFNSFNNVMQPDQGASIHHHADELLPKQAAQYAGQLEREEEAAALLHHMQHEDQHHLVRQGGAASIERMYVDHENGYGAAEDHALAVDRGMLQRPALHGARENSGSSDGSAAYFSGDSDLTAEPIMGRSCGTGDNEADGDKSSNSGSSSTPLLKPKNSQTVRIDQTHPAAFNSAGLGVQACSVNLPILDEKAYDLNEEVRYASLMATTTALINLAPSTSTTSASRRCKDPQTVVASPEVMRMVHAREEQQISSCRQCSTSPPESADSGRNLKENWLELRLGFSTESMRAQSGKMQGGQNYDASGDEQRKWSESEQADALEEERVTLQLLPAGPRPNVISEACSDQAAIKPSMPAAQNPPAAEAISGLYPSSSIPPLYYPPTSTFLHSATVPFDVSNFHRLTAGAVLPPASGLPSFHNQTRDANALSSQYFDQFLQSSTQSYRQYPVLSGSDERRENGYHYLREGQRWASSEAIFMDMTVGGTASLSTAPVSIGTSAQPPEICRPTASLGWPPGTALVPGAGSDGRPWSASSVYNTQQQNNMSWQGLLRSMANDPFLHAHTLRDASMQYSFDNGAILQTSAGVRRRHMFPPACARPPSSQASAPSALAAPQRLRLASSLRSSALWFSLQEADHFPLEEKDQLSNHCLQKLYLRIRDGKMRISVVKSYLIKKLGSAGLHHYNPDEVDITCRGQVLSPSLTMQHVRDTIWLSKDVEVDAIGFRYTTSQINNSPNRVMALCYQRHPAASQNLTLNLLKI